MSILGFVISAFVAVGGGMVENVSSLNNSIIFDPIGVYTGSSDLLHSFYNDYIDDSIEDSKISRFAYVNVLTPGMGGSASDWIRKDCSYYYVDDFTLPYQLCHANNRYNNLGFQLSHSIDNFYVFNTSESGCVGRLVLDETYTEGNRYQVEYLSHFEDDDPLSTMVFIYDGYLGNESDNENTLNGVFYNRFKNALNVVLAGIAEKQCGYLPKINLIGHSRGGIINLLYAHDYPEIVSNLISLGTPYMGSEWADAYVYFKKAINGSDNFVSYDDMLDPNKPQYYAQFLDDIDDDVNSLAIGFDQTSVYFLNSITHVLTNTSLIDLIESEISDMTNGMISENNVDSFVQIMFDLFLDLVNHLADSVIPSAQSFLSILSTLLSNENFANFSASLSCLESIRQKDVIDYYLSNLIKSDIAVNTDSQLGYERERDEITGNFVEYYHFDNRLTITLGDANNDSYYSGEYCSQPCNYWVAHNFETKNPNAISAIIAYLNNHNGFHEHNYYWNMTNTTHREMCSCLALRVASENHNLIVESYDSTIHRIYCSVCSYLTTESHNFTYINLGDGTHKRVCADCGYMITGESHVYDHFTNFTVLKHTRCCACGVLGATENHNVNFITGKCRVCGYAVASPGIDPEFPFH